LSCKNLPLGDFFFIDGGHSLETIDSDWKNCKRLMHDRSIIVLDDYWHGNYKQGCASLIDTLGVDYRCHLLGLDIVDGKNNPPLVISLAKVQLRKDIS